MPDRSHATLEELSSYLDGELRGPRLVRIEEHVAGCDECRERLAGLRRVVSRLAGVERSQPPPHLGYQLRREAALRRGRPTLAERVEAPLRRLLIQPALAPAFAVVLALAAILYLLSLGIARRQDGATRIVVQPGGEVPVAELPADPEESRRAAGRWFDRREGTWIERGLEDEPAMVRGWPPGDPPAGLTAGEAAALRELGGPVRLRLEDGVVELVPEG